MDLSDEMYDKCEKLMYILRNLEQMLADVETSAEDLTKAKNELVE